MVAGLRLFSERTAEGSGEPIFGDDEESMLVQPAVSIVLGNRPPLSPGTLYISSKKMVWLSDMDRAVGYAVDFLSVSLHAVSRDPEAYPSPCIYAQIETGDGYEDDNDDLESSDTESNDVLDLSKISEIRFVPSDPTQLDTMFEVFCECAELNPEPIEGEEEEEEHNWIFSADQVETEEGDDSEWNDSLSLTSTIGVSNGDHELAHTVLQLQINDQRFEDAEEIEGDGNSSHP